MVTWKEGALSLVTECLFISPVLRWLQSDCRRDKEAKLLSFGNFQAQMNQSFSLEKQLLKVPVIVSTSKPNFGWRWGAICLCRNHNSSYLK
jgi:hypothetical protein